MNTSTFEACHGVVARGSHLTSSCLPHARQCGAMAFGVVMWHDLDLWFVRVPVHAYVHVHAVELARPKSCCDAAEQCALLRHELR